MRSEREDRTGLAIQRGRTERNTALSPWTEGLKGKEELDDQINMEAVEGEKRAAGVGLVSWSTDKTLWNPKSSHSEWILQIKSKSGFLRFMIQTFFFWERIRK